jgi:hypothetical protein
MQLVGGCRCGAVSFTAEVDPGQVFACSCEECNTLPEASFREVAITTAGKLTEKGETTVCYTGPENAVQGGQVVCSACGAALYAFLVLFGVRRVIDLSWVDETVELNRSRDRWQHWMLPWPSMMLGNRKPPVIPKVPSGSTGSGST